MKPQSRHPSSAARQRGAATLIVVMVLFFIVSLMAAYTSRNMIFEQKTSANQYRATQAFEAAEAGLEWALTMLNGGRLEDNCTAHTAMTTPPAPATPPTKASFRERYLNIAVNTPPVIDGTLTVTRATATTDAAPRLWPTCVFNGAVWKCSCPINTEADPDATPVIGYSGPQPAFRVRLLADVGRPGVLRLESTGCTRLAEGCLSFQPTSLTGEGVAMVSTLVALRSGVATVPAAALTARGTVSGDPAAVFNTDPGTNGITVQTGGASPNLMPTSLPGTPGALSIINNDPTLSVLTHATLVTGRTDVDRMFVAVFGMRRVAWQQQPGLRVCTAPCDSAAVNALLANYPHRAIRVVGDLALDGNIGNVDDPVVLVVEGAIEATGTPATVVGLIYLDDPSADIEANTGSATVIRGALVGDRAIEVDGTGSLQVHYDAAVLARLRTTYGSFVRVPGAWHDWRTGP
jgi:hypothetical protein